MPPLSGVPTRYWNESGPAAVVEQFWAADAVYREGPGWPDAGVYRGRAAALERMQSLIELVGPIEVRIDDLIDLGDGRLIACVRMLGESATSDTPYTQTFAVVQRLRDGLVVEADYYLDRAAALEAVGLRGSRTRGPSHCRTGHEHRARDSAIGHFVPIDAELMCRARIDRLSSPPTFSSAARSHRGTT